MDLTAKLSKCPIRFQEERNKRRDGVEKPIRGLAEKDCVDDTDGNPFCRPILSPLLLSLIQREREREREREEEEVESNQVKHVLPALNSENFFCLIDQ